MNGASIYFDRFFFSSIAHLKNNILKIPQKPIAGWLVRWEGVEIWAEILPSDLENLDLVVNC